MLLLGIIKKYNKNYESNLYYSWSDFFTDTFSPATEIYKEILFKVSGKTYTEKQESLRQLAIDYQLSNAYGLSCGEYAEITNFFEKNAKRYGLIKEFKENGII